MVSKGRAFYETLYQEVFFWNPGGGGSLIYSTFSLPLSLLFILFLLFLLWGEFPLLILSWEFPCLAWLIPQRWRILSPVLLQLIDPSPNFLLCLVLASLHVYTSVSPYISNVFVFSFDVWCVCICCLHSVCPIGWWSWWWLLSIILFWIRLSTSIIIYGV